MTPPRTCTVRGCTTPTIARNWCESHYRRWRRHGTPTGGRLRGRTGCNATNCNRAHDAKGYCSKHYQRMKRHGDADCIPARELDEIAVERAVFGDPPDRLTTAEREQAVRRLHRIGLTDRRIAEHVGLGASGVRAIRCRLGLPATGHRPVASHRTAA